MPVLDPQAEELNRIIKTQNPVVYELLSGKGKSIYFPAKGILAQGAAAKDKEINATIGTAYEDDGRPMVLPSLASRLQIDSKEAFPYAPSDGLKALRNKWQELMRVKNPSLGNRDISLPLVASGVTNGLSIVGYMFAEEKSPILLSDLYWENYDLVYANAYNAELKFFNLFKNNTFDIDSFQKAITSDPTEKKIVILNFPNNPTGYTPSKTDAEKIITALTAAAEAGNRLVVVMDDSYFGLAFEDEIYKESLFAQLSQAHTNLLAIKVDGITKEEYAWGFRVGFITYGIKNGSKELYKALEDKTAGAIRGNISNAAHPSQSLFLAALKSATYEQEKKRNIEKMHERYSKVKEVLKAHPEYNQYFEALPFNSGYFMCVRLKGINPEKAWQTLLNKYSTGVVCYSDKSIFRIAFASVPTNKMEKLFNNIYSACKDCA